MKYLKKKVKLNFENNVHVDKEDKFVLTYNTNKKTQNTKNILF